MPNPHYQRVLEQDHQLWPPMRWFTRAMSSWWTMGVLGIVVVGYVALALIPLGGRYLWQSPLIDSTQQAVLSWWPLVAAAWLLAVVLFWAAMRRLSWRLANLGIFLVVIGLMIVLTLQSWGFRAQSSGVVPVRLDTVPLNQDERPSPATLNYTAKFGDTHDREIMVVPFGIEPIVVPVPGLPRWNDAAGDAMPSIKLHEDQALATAIGYTTRVTVAAYVASGTLTDHPDGTESVTPTAPDPHHAAAMPYPMHALVALRFTTDLDDGKTGETIVWLPFEPDAPLSLIPRRVFNIPGLGFVALAFRPASDELPFELAATIPEPQPKRFSASLFAAQTDRSGMPIQAAEHTLSDTGTTTHANSPAMFADRYQLNWLGEINDGKTALVGFVTRPMEPYVVIGLVVFVVGVVLDRLLDWLLPAPKRKPAAPSKSSADSPNLDTSA